MYDVNVLVNGSRCKQYHHNGKIFIEAKDGSEYTLEIKNNTWKRILAVCSVDGLDILNGKTAKTDGPGYVINSFSAGKFDGFRVSNDKVAKFIFGAKGESYAASKEDGSERNVGVIGIRLFEEKEKPLPPPPVEIHHHHWPKPTTIWTDHTYTTSCCRSDTLGLDDADFDNGNDYKSAPSNTKGSSIPYSKKISNPIRGRRGLDSGIKTVNACMSFGDIQPAANFDMGTKWGEAKESRVVEVEFERGILAMTTNIYYASRQSLIEMGVPIGNEKQVNFPEPFKDTGYAKPPTGWRG